MPGRRLVLHVGPQRTGSSYLQHHLAAHRATLADFGVSYPRLEPTGTDHRVLPSRLRGWTQAPGVDAVEAQLPELRSASTLLLSSIGFADLDARHLAGLRDLFPDHEITVIYVLRSLTQLAPSHWHEAVRHGDPCTLPEFLANAEQRGSGDVPFRGPVAQLAALAEAFGPEALTILDYHGTSPHGGGLMGAFLEHALMLPPNLFPVDDVTVNPSQPPSRVELLRSLNERHVATGRPPAGPRLREAYAVIRPEVEPTPEWKAWVAEFTAVATPLTLSDSDPWPRSQGLAVAEAYADRMVSPLGSPPARSVTPCAPAGWAKDSSFVGTIFDRLVY